MYKRQVISGPRWLQLTSAQGKPPQGRLVTFSQANTQLPPSPNQSLSLIHILLLYDGVNLNYYSSAGAPKWTTNVGSIADVAIGPSGTIYTSTSTTLSAWSATTGASAWSQPYTVNTGNETSALAIDSHETVYMVSGASFVGPPGKVTAINADGSLKWDNPVSYTHLEYQLSFLSRMLK